jgi:hypothetical protein
VINGRCIVATYAQVSPAEADQRLAICLDDGAGTVTARLYGSQGLIFEKRLQVGVWPSAVAPHAISTYRKKSEGLLIGMTDGCVYVVKGGQYTQSRTPSREAIKAFGATLDMHNGDFLTLDLERSCVRWWGSDCARGKWENVYWHNRREARSEKKLKIGEVIALGAGFHQYSIVLIRDDRQIEKRSRLLLCNNRDIPGEGFYRMGELEPPYELPGRDDYGRWTVANNAVACCETGIVRIWRETNVFMQQMQYDIPDALGLPTGIALSQDGAEFAVTSGNKVFWSKLGEVLTQEERVSSLALSVDGSELLIGAGSSTVCYSLGEHQMMQDCLGRANE